MVIDGSSYSEMAPQMLKALRLPANTEVTILTFVPEPTFLGGISLDAIMGASQARQKANDEQQEKAIEILEHASQSLGEADRKNIILYRS